MTFKHYIPNTITSLNLLCGSIAVVYAFEGYLHIAALLVIIASVFDFLDGFSARLLKAYSAVGKELDSLADLISFGLAPSVIVYISMQQHVPQWGPEWAGLNILPFIAFLITVFSGLRLAIFNIDENQTEHFIGLPTPANAIFFISFPLALQYGSEQSFLFPFYQGITRSYYILAFLAIVSSYLMLSNLPLFSLKFKNLQFRPNRIRYIFVVVCAGMLLLLGIHALPLFIVWYILLSLADYLFKIS
ncbi:MAG: CDP-diacylglycerol--serine O-phosphatidyltransferase [Bacteroidetes bacterium]|nr:MAG: CDP-diacylglycerol--serine O-phosphatidyltransferase [Bacteroidota bacterium]